MVAFTADGFRANTILLTRYLVSAIHRSIPTTELIGVGFLLLGSGGYVQWGYAYCGAVLGWILFSVLLFWLK